MDDEQMTRADCPVCGKSFPVSFINTHVNECLNVSNVEEEMSQSKKRKSTDTNQAKSWGFLKDSGGTGSANKKMKLFKSQTVTAPSNSANNTGDLQHTKSSRNDSDSNSDDDAVIIEDEKVGRRGKYENFKIRSPSSDSESKMKNMFTKHDYQSKPYMQQGQASLTKGCSNAKKPFAPLAERMRPSTLEDYVGQTQAVGKQSLLYSLLRSEHIPSMVFWGPPGCGKTTLAKIIANNCKSRRNIKFVQLSAATSGVNDVKQMVNIAKTDQKMFKKKTILFLDEIHRFNKTQQDSLLPHVEDGTITLIGATTENPSFQVNSALLSRCRVIVLEKLSVEELSEILNRAVTELGGRVYESLEDLDEQKEMDGEKPQIWVEKQAVVTLANLCDGDARASLNGLQMAVESRVMAARFSKDENKNSVVMVNTDHVKDGLQRSHVLYDRAGEEHYNIISAMHKSIRGSDATAALYWLARMLEGGENPLYIARRLVRIASEDIGLADPLALNQAVSAYQACHFIGMPECDVILAQCVVYMARAPKSVEVYFAYKKAKSCVREHEGAMPSVPLHLRNAPTKLMKSLGYGEGYKYNPDYDGFVEQEYLPVELRGTDFFT